MGFQLGPGFLRKPPRGWLPARVHAVDFKIYDRRGEGGGGNDGSLIDVWIMDVQWRVQPEGDAAYEFREERRAPMWVKRGGVATGKRSFSLRVRPQHGLQTEVPIPCYVNPDRVDDIWVDWDAAYELHEPVWERIARVEREVNRQRGGLDALVDRVTNPFAGKVRPEDAAYVEQERAEDRAQEAAVQAQMDAVLNTPVQVDLRRRMEEETRIGQTGREVTATVVGIADTGRMLGDSQIPIFDLALDLDEDGGSRRVVYEHAAGARHAKRYKPGKQVRVRIDPDNPERVALMA
jgi:hypothetical protein